MRVETREVEIKVFEETLKRAEEKMMDNKMREEEVVVGKEHKATVGAKKPIASMVGNYRRSSSGGRSRKEVMDEKAEEVKERVISMTMQAPARQSQPP